MAINRTFQFCGIGYGNSPVSVTAQVNSTTIFSGEIPTIDEPIDPVPYPIPAAANTTVLFSIEDSALLNTDFSGSLPMTISVTGGQAALFTFINSNYYTGNVQVNPDAGTANGYGLDYTGTPTNSEGTPDCRSSVAINGVQQVPPLEPSTGCWSWLVPTASTIAYNWNIGVGQVGNIPGNTVDYTPPV
jgi:hypothetical protein